jgi:alanine dehydrogenase
MNIGVPKEIKADEYRVALVPAGARELARSGHQVIVEAGAGEGSGFPDDAYLAVGARVTDVAGAWEADLVLKVKEPLEAEYGYLRKDLTLFTYLHLAAAPRLTEALVASGATCIAYETVETADGRLPLLAPMSEAAGRLAPQVGAASLQKPNGGRGALIGGLPGVAPSRVVILGGGSVGYNAALIAAGMQADVWILERSIDRIRELDLIFGGRVTVAHSGTAGHIEEVITGADLLIGAVLIPGARAPRIVTRAMLDLLRPGAVVVDVAIDQGGCFETSRPTTHSDPTFSVAGVVHYCVANMPGAVPATATAALTNATFPYVELLASAGPEAAIGRSTALARGVNVTRGLVTNAAVAEAAGLAYTAPPERVVA